MKKKYKNQIREVNKSKNLKTLKFYCNHTYLDFLKHPSVKKELQNIRKEDAQRKMKKERRIKT
jgi:hypothetical protein